MHIGVKVIFSVDGIIAIVRGTPWVWTFLMYQVWQLAGPAIGGRHALHYPPKRA